MRRRILVTATLVSACAMLCSCASASQSNIPTGTVTTPSTTITDPDCISVKDPAGVRPCTPEMLQYVADHNQAYGEAESLFRQFVQEDSRLLTRGGTASPTLANMLTGKAVSDYAAMSQVPADVHLTATGEAKIQTLKRAADATYPNSEIALASCVDGSGIEIYADGKFTRRGNIVDYAIYFTRVDGKLKIVHLSGTRAESC